jgi:hypothetical protein
MGSGVLCVELLNRPTGFVELDTINPAQERQIVIYLRNELVVFGWQGQAEAGQRIAGGVACFRYICQGTLQVLEIGAQFLEGEVQRLAKTVDGIGKRVSDLVRDRDAIAEVEPASLATAFSRSVDDDR